MKFTANHLKLSSALELISRLPGSSGTIIPALLHGDIGGLFVTRRTPFAQASIPVEGAEIDEPGEIEVFPENLARIINRLGTKKAPIEIESNDTGVLVKGIGNAKLTRIEPEPAPEPLPDGEETIVKTKVEELSLALRDTEPYCANPALDNRNGILFHDSFGGLCLIGTNGQRFHRVRLAKKYEGPKVILPPDAASFIRATLATCKGEQKVEMAIGENYIKVKTGDIQVRLALAAVPPVSFPPDIVKKWDSKAPAMVDLDQDELIDALDRLEPLAAANDEGARKLSLRRSGNIFTMHTPGNVAEVTLNLPCEGRKLEEPVWVNATYLKDAVAMFKGEDGRLTIDYLPEEYIVRVERGNRNAVISVLRIA